MTETLLDQLYAEVPKAKKEIYNVGDKTPLEHVQLNGENFDYMKRRVGYEGIEIGWKVVVSVEEVRHR